MDAVTQKKLARKDLSASDPITSGSASQPIRRARKLRMTRIRSTMQSRRFVVVWDY